MVEAFTTARIDLSVDDALAVARDWEPDLVVHDVMDFVGPFVAIACGARRVGHTFGSDVSADYHRTPVRNGRHRTTDPNTGQLGGRHLPE